MNETAAILVKNEALIDHFPQIDRSSMFIAITVPLNKQVTGQWRHEKSGLFRFDCDEAAGVSYSSHEAAQARFSTLSSFTSPLHLTMTTVVDRPNGKQVPAPKLFGKACFILYANKVLIRVFGLVWQIWSTGSWSTWYDPESRYKRLPSSVLTLTPSMTNRIHHISVKLFGRLEKWQLWLTASSTTFTYHLLSLLYERTGRIEWSDIALTASNVYHRLWGM